MNGSPAIIGLAAIPIIATADVRIDIFADGEVEFLRESNGDRWSMRTKGHEITITCNEESGRRTDAATAEHLRRIATVMLARPTGAIA